MNTPLQDILQFYTRAVPLNVMTLVQQATSRETCESWYRILQATFSCETLSRDRAKLLRQYLCGFREQMGVLAFITHLLGARADSYTHQKRCELAISFSPPCYREAMTQDRNFDGLATCLGKLWKSSTDWRHLHADLADHNYPVLRLLDYLKANPGIIDRALWPTTLAEAS